jgi:hypothetical protein
MLSTFPGARRVFVMNVLAFALMGLQTRPIIERLSPEQRWGSLVFGLSVLAVVIVVRVAWLAMYRRSLPPSGAGVPASPTGWLQGIDAAPSSWPGAACAALSRWRLHLHCRMGAT